VIEQVPCTDEATEARYLGACMIDGEALGRCPVWPRHMWNRAHRTILETLLARHQANEPTDVVAVAMDLKSRGLLDGVGGEHALRGMTIDVELYPAPLAQRLRELATARELRDHARRILALVETDLPEAMREARDAAELKHPTQNDGERYGTMPAAVMSAIQEIRDRATRSKSRPPFVATGIKALDRKIFGVEYGDLTVIGGDTSVGKSTTALYMACAMARAGHRPGIISCEDAAPRMGRRVLSMLSGVPAAVLRSGDLSEWQWKRISGAAVTVNDMTIELAYCIGEDVDRVTEAARVLINERGCDVVFLDYVQAVDTPGQDERRGMRTILTRFKRECNRAVPPASGVVLSQMRRRENIHEKPNRSMLYESGYLEQKADSIILLWKDEHGALMGVLDKGKDDATGIEFSFSRDANGMLEEDAL
jgi:replicative DNA helicase